MKQRGKWVLDLTCFHSSDTIQTEIFDALMGRNFSVLNSGPPDSPEQGSQVGLWKAKLEVEHTKGSSGRLDG